MAGIDKTGDATKDICWARGDTKPRVFTKTDANGAAIDVSASTFRMTVNTDKNPSVASPGTVLFTAVGVFVTDGTDGQVQFAPTGIAVFDSLTLPTTAYYDIEETDGVGAIETLIKGRVLIEQDTSK